MAIKAGIKIYSRTIRSLFYIYASNCLKCMIDSPRYFASRHRGQLSALPGSRSSRLEHPTDDMQTPDITQPLDRRITAGRVSICPICTKPIDIDTMCFIRTSTKAYDYTCLLEHVQKTGKCPSTGYPAAAVDIRRIYLN
jgi:hypothetical protein